MRGPVADQQALWQRYSDNWVRHLGVVAEQGDRSVRESLEAAGYSSLGQQFIAPLSLLYVKKQRASTMAASLGVSQAYTAKVLNRLEKAAYIERTEDAADRRARWVQLSPAGRELIVAALQQLTALSREHRRQLGESAYQHFIDSLRAVGEAFLRNERRIAPPGLASDLSAISLSAVSELMQRAIARLNTAGGYGRLSVAHWRVLHDLGLEGSTNAVLAERQQLSTQAISRTVRDLLAMGYIESSRDECDGRVARLIYSGRGLELLASTADNIEVLGRTVAKEMPAGAFVVFCRALACLYGSVSSISPVDGKFSDSEGQAEAQLKTEFAALVDALLQGRDRIARPDSLFSAAETRVLTGIIKSKLP